MKRLTLVALGLLIASPALAQQTITRTTLLSAYDLDGEAADVDQVVAATAIVDDGTSAGDTPDYTIIANPDVCRLLDLTIVDTNLNSGTLTVTGTGCLGEARTCSFAFTAGDDTGVKTLTCTDGQGAYFKTVTLVTTGTMVGESDETFALGYSTNSANGWAMYGKLKPTGPSGERGVDPFGSYEVNKLITTSGSCSTTVAGVSAADDVYQNVSAGDLLLFTVRDDYGQVANYERKLVTRSSADSGVIGGSCVTIPAAGVTFRYKKQFFSTNPYDQVWIPVAGYSAVAFNYSVDSNTDTGGVIATLECLDSNGPDFPTGEWVQINTTTTATTSTLSPTATALGPVLLSRTPFSYCRVALKFGTGDDDDTGVEDINLSVLLEK
jgi:hypothetical protein